ncbi:hypothetical protein [Caballeronia cordobensis]|uniref:hypothetical protein n=1 Tax=Caballeronia cordobensis TaxID=1353886 RepID=UPI000B249ABB|nr:hypothetical protein [Caballeronia cordobensis]
MDDREILDLVCGQSIHIEVNAHFDGIEPTRDTVIANKFDLDLSERSEPIRSGGCYCKPFKSRY